ncbi:MAG: hypothetical protein E7627_01010 [Ruminococcaceae bacterium]|nr:hypothetical protein [Oscillospiraceae bacterium]
MSEISRYDRQYFVGVGGDKTPLWTPVGEGFLRFEEKKNPQEVYRRYYHEEDLRGDIDGYSSEIVYEAELVKGSAAIDKLNRIANEELFGKEGAVEIMTVDFFNEVLPGVYRAYVRAYSVCPENCGEGAESLKIRGRLIANGELTIGQFISSTGTFTE